jgi:hypothetical protein
MEGREEFSPLAEKQQENHEAEADAERVADCAFASLPWDR